MTGVDRGPASPVTVSGQSCPGDRVGPQARGSDVQCRVKGCPGLCVLGTVASAPRQRGDQSGQPQDEPFPPFRSLRRETRT